MLGPAHYGRICARTRAHCCHKYAGTRAHGSHICTGAPLNTTISPPGLDSPMSHVCRDSAHRCCLYRDSAQPCLICVWTKLASTYVPHLHLDLAHCCHSCTGHVLIAATSAPGLGAPLPHLHSTRLTTTRAPGLGSQLAHLRRDWAHRCSICSGTWLTSATSGPNAR
jgi:hypothetical protein